MTGNCDYCMRPFDKASIGCEREHDHKEPDLAERIAHDIENDVTDRSGLGNQFESIERPIQQEIRDAWTQIIKKHLDGNH